MRLMICRLGPGQEILPAGLKKKRLRGKKPERQEKTNGPSPRSLPVSGQRKTNVSQKEKGAAKGKSLLSPDGPAPAGSFSLLAGVPYQAPPRKSYLRASRKKQVLTNKPQRQEKPNSDLFFLLASDGKLTIKFTCPYGREWHDSCGLSIVVNCRTGV